MPTNDLKKLAIEWTSAGIGCACADGAMNPLEIIKVRMQAKSGPSRSLSVGNVIKVGEKTVKAEGIEGILSRSPSHLLEGVLLCWISLCIRQ